MSKQRQPDAYDLARHMGVGLHAIMERHREIEPDAEVMAYTKLAPDTVRKIMTTPREHLDELEGFTWRTAPANITTTQAALLAHVKPATIRQWATRGEIDTTGKDGRQVTYSRDEVRQVSGEMATRARARRVSPGHVSEGHDDAEVTLTEAARAFNLSPATMRSWVHRGHLEPTGETHGKRPLYRIGDVRSLAYERG